MDELADSRPRGGAGSIGRIDNWTTDELTFIFASAQTFGPGPGAGSLQSGRRDYCFFACFLHLLQNVSCMEQGFEENVA